MRIIVQTDDGFEMLSYSTEPNTMALHPGPHDTRVVIAALAEAITFLSPKLHDDGETFNIVDAVNAVEKPASHLKLVD